MIDLDRQDIKFLPGVGPQRAKLLGDELQIRTLHDLLYTFPYKHIDRTRLYYIHELTADMPYVQIRGQILSFDTEGEGRKRRLVAHFTDGQGVVDLIWFNGIKYICQPIRRGRIISCSGGRVFSTGESTSLILMWTRPMNCV